MYTCSVENQFGVQDASAFITITGIGMFLIVHGIHVYTFGMNSSQIWLISTSIVCLSVRPIIAYSNPLINSITGRTVRLTCVVLLGNPRPKVMWFKMGELVTPREGLTDDGNGNLVTYN